MQHTAGAGTHPSPQSCACQTHHAEHHRDPAPRGTHPILGTALTSQDYVPVCNSTKATGYYWVQSTQEKQTKAHLYSFTGGTARSHAKERTVGSKMWLVFSLRTVGRGEKKKALDCLIIVQKAASHPHFQKATRVCGFSVFGTRAQWKQACLL